MSGLLILSLRGLETRHKLRSISVGIVTGVFASLASIAFIYGFGFPAGETPAGTALRGYAVFAVLSLITCGIAQIVVAALGPKHRSGSVVSMALIVSTFVSLSEVMLSMHG